MSDTNQTETNGTTSPAATPSPLIAIREAFEAAGGAEKMDKKAALKARDAYQAAMQEVAKVEATLKLAQKAAQEKARDLMVLTGAQPIKFGGVQYNPTSRGETLFYRPAGSKDILSLDK